MYELMSFIIISFLMPKNKRNLPSTEDILDRKSLEIFLKLTSIYEIYYILEIKRNSK